MKTYKLSLHSHTSDFVHFVLTKPNKEDYINNLLTGLFKKHGNVVLGVTNFNDDRRYEKLYQSLKNISKDYVIEDSNKDFFFSITNKDKVIHFIKTDEIETEKGHILIIGFKGKIKKRNLRDVLKEAHNEHCIIIANHPLHEFNISYFLVKRLFGETNSISLSEKELLKYKNDFDAVELNSYFSEDWKKIKKFGKTNKIPIISDSDAHFLDEIFVSWYEVNNLDFKSPIRFKKSLKYSLKKTLHLHAKKQGYYVRYRHIIQVIFEKVGVKLGLLSLH